jgi:2-phosphoglycolate phosphatase
MVLAVLFDIDGTLLDTLGSIVAAMNDAIRDTGIRPFGLQELRPLIGTSVPHQLEVLRGRTGPSADAFTDRYYDAFMRRMEESIVLYPGVAETFPVLRGVRIGTASTRRAREARRMLELAGLLPAFDSVVGGDQVSRPKPNPDLPLHGARSLGVSPDACALVGDSPVDVRAGKAAGMRTVAVTYGYGDPAALRAEAPDATVDRFADLLRVLGAWR